MDLIHLPVLIKTDGQELTLTPQGLLNFYLPGAHEMENFPGVYEGYHPTDPNKRVYIQAPVLVAVLMEAQRKRLNPVTDLYVITSSSPTKMASWKLKYTAPIERARKVPGFLGIDFGITVLRDKAVVRCLGYAMSPGDTLYGAWAALYLAGKEKPLEHETTLAVAKGMGPLWNTNPAFMVCKACIDHLLTRKYPMVVAEDEEEQTDAIEVPADHYQWKAGERQAGGSDAPTGASTATTPGEQYEGTVKRVKAPLGKSPGAIEVALMGGDVMVLWFFKLPAALEDGPDLPNFETTLARFTFTDRTDKKTGKVFHNLGEFAWVAMPGTEETAGDTEESPTIEEVA